MESKILLNDCCSHRRQERSDVNPHVEEIISAVLEVTPVRIEIPDHCRDVRLEEPVSDYQTSQRRVNKGKRAHRQQQVTRHKKETPDHHRSPVAKLPFGDPTSNQRPAINEHTLLPPNLHT